MDKTMHVDSVVDGYVVEAVGSISILCKHWGNKVND